MSSKKTRIDILIDTINFKRNRKKRSAEYIENSNLSGKDKFELKQTLKQRKLPR